MNHYSIINNDAKTPEILLYGFIGNWQETDSKSFIADLKALEANHAQINVRINSGGGSVFEGITIYNALKNSPAEIHTYIDGLAASMASVIAMAGAKVFMSRFAQLMVHKVSGTANGDAEKMRETATLMDNLEQSLITIYSERTGLSPEEVTAKWMQRGTDNWFSAAQAIKQQFVDEIFDSGVVRKAPSKKDSPNAVWEFYNHQISNSLNNKHMFDLPQFRAVCGLSETATEQDVLAAFTNQQNKLKSLQDDNKKLSEENNVFLAQIKEAEKQKVKDLIDNAIKENRITEEHRSTYTALAEANYDATKAALSAITPYKSIMAQINVVDDEAAAYKTFRDYQEKAPHLLAEMKQNNPEKYTALYKKEFGKLPKP